MDGWGSRFGARFWRPTRPTNVLRLPSRTRTHSRGARSADRAAVGLVLRGGEAGGPLQTRGGERSHRRGHRGVDHAGPISRWGSGPTGADRGGSAGRDVAVGVLRRSKTPSRRVSPDQGRLTVGARARRGQKAWSERREAFASRATLAKSVGRTAAGGSRAHGGAERGGKRMSMGVVGRAGGGRRRRGPPCRDGVSKNSGARRGEGGAREGEGGANTTPIRRSHVDLPPIQARVGPPAYMFTN